MFENNDTSKEVISTNTEEVILQLLVTIFSNKNINPVILKHCQVSDGRAVNIN